MPDYFNAAQAASSLALNCSAADISCRARALNGDHQPDGGYHEGRIEPEFRRLAEVLGYSVEKLPRPSAAMEAERKPVAAE